MSDNHEPLVLINLFSMPPERVDDFVAAWERNIDSAKGAKGFRGTRLHRCLDPLARHQVVNIARWDSAEDWEATFSRLFSAPRLDGPTDVSAEPHLYEVVHVTPDPQDGVTP